MMLYASEEERRRVYAELKARRDRRDRYAVFIDEFSLTGCGLIHRDSKECGTRKLLSLKRPVNTRGGL